MADKESISATHQETTVHHAQDADEAWKVFAGLDPATIVVDEATNKRLLRKIDLMLMPVRLLQIHTRYTVPTLIWLAFLFSVRPEFPRQ